MGNIWVRPGRGVAVGVAEAIVELQGDDRLGEVIVVVPPGATAGTLRRLLPRVSGGVAGIRFLTPIDLAVELVDSSVSTMRAVTTQLQLAAITSALSSDDCPQVLHDVRDHPATIDALVDMAMALRAAHVVPGALQSLVGDPTSVRAALVDVIVRARQCLAGLGIRDESATLAALADVEDAVLAGLRVVLVVTDTFHPAQVPFLGRLASQPRTRIVSVVPDPADAGLVDQLAQFGCSDVPASGDIAGVTAVPRLISCPDPDEEVRHTIRQCAELIDDGVPADDIAIVCAAPAYRRPVRDELQRAGIAWSGGAVERLSGSVAGQALRHIVDGIVGQWDRPNVFRLLSVAPLYPVGELGGPRRVGQWTTLCRKLGLVTESDWARATRRWRQPMWRGGSVGRRTSPTPHRPLARPPIARHWTDCRSWSSGFATNRERSSARQRGKRLPGSSTASSPTTSGYPPGANARGRMVRHGSATLRTMSSELSPGSPNSTTTESPCHSTRRPCVKSSAPCSTHRFGAAATLRGRSRSSTSVARCASMPAGCSSSASTKACSPLRPQTTCCWDAIFPTLLRR